MGYKLRFIEKYDIEAMARAVYNAGINLAFLRDDWLRLMISMAGGGEQLLDSFLLLASMSVEKYKERENRRLFLKAVRKSCDAGLKYFIDLCRKNGIMPNDYLAPAALADSYQCRSTWRQNNNQTNHNQPQPTSTQATTMQPFTTLPTANIIHRIDYKWVEKFGQGKDSSFHRSVVASGLLTPEELQAASEIFHLGTTKDKRVVYWQIDAEGRVRDGKADGVRREVSPRKVGWQRREEQRFLGRLRAHETWSARKELGGYALPFRLASAQLAPR